METNQISIYDSSFYFILLIFIKYTPTLWIVLIKFFFLNFSPRFKSQQRFLFQSTGSDFNYTLPKNLNKYFLLLLSPQADDLNHNKRS